jgi:hypothetical protein
VQILYQINEFLSFLFIFHPIKHIFLNKSGHARACPCIQSYLLFPDLEDDDDLEEEDLDPLLEEEDFETLPEAELLALETEPDDLGDDILLGVLMLLEVPEDDLGETEVLLSLVLLKV